jgi:hypothetical protein
VLALGLNIERAMSEIRADLPIGIESHLAADQPKVVKSASEFGQIASRPPAELCADIVQIRTPEHQTDWT